MANIYKYGGKSMREVKYMISDTAKKVDVEAHVLRYWEEELELPIGRNEMGHRYYTPENILLFKNIKELKEQGFQLRAIKMLLPELMKHDSKGIENLLLLKEELNYQVNAMTQEPVEEAAASLEQAGLVEMESNCTSLEEDKISQFQEILTNVVKKALRENNKELGKEMGRQVSDHVIKEMDYMVRINEEREEERFKKLDETIRNLQKTRQEIAIAKKQEKNNKKRLFRRKKSEVSKREDV